MNPELVPIFSLYVFLGVGIGWRMLHQWAVYGTSGLALFSAGRLKASLAIAFPLLGLAQATVRAVRPRLLDPYLAFDSPALLVAGALLVLAATVAMAIAQLDLGASWRIGIEPGARPGLVTSGLYRVSRNPIFAFMLLAIAGHVLTLPTWFSLAFFLVAFVVVRTQVREEERWLIETYGDDYRAYASRVGRFFPFVGRI